MTQSSSCSILHPPDHHQLSRSRKITLLTSVTDEEDEEFRTLPLLALATRPLASGATTNTQEMINCALLDRRNDFSPAEIFAKTLVPSHSFPESIQYHQHSCPTAFEITEDLRRLAYVEPPPIPIWLATCLRW